MLAKRTFRWLTAAVMLIGLVGCPSEKTDYDRGFDDGFMRDDWYWTGFDDGYDTIGSTLYYQGSKIPVGTASDYEEGYWDGVWWSYNDGYFVQYDYAFTIGFSDGYDAAFYPGYLEFLGKDQHVELYNGGWTDGYNDGFSEGRVFGANDYEQGLSFDWLDALLDYRSGTDLYFKEVNVGTGKYGPVTLYKYGDDPTKTTKTTTSLRGAGNRPVPAIRSTAEKATVPNPTYRTLSVEEQEKYRKTPTTPATPRNDGRALTLKTSWLDRINAFEQMLKQKNVQ